MPAPRVFSDDDFVDDTQSAPRVFSDEDFADTEPTSPIKPNPVRDAMLAEKKRRGVDRLGGSVTPDELAAATPETRLATPNTDIPYARASGVDEKPGIIDRLLAGADTSEKVLETAQRWNLPNNIFESGRKALAPLRAASNPMPEETPTVADVATILGGSGAIPPVRDLLEKYVGPALNPTIAKVFGAATSATQPIRDAIAPTENESTLKAAAMFPVRTYAQARDVLGLDPANAVLAGGTAGMGAVAKGVQAASEGAFLADMLHSIPQSMESLADAGVNKGAAGALQALPEAAVPVVMAGMLGRGMAGHAARGAESYRDFAGTRKTEKLLQENYQSAVRKISQNEKASDPRLKGLDENELAAYFAGNEEGNVLRRTQNVDELEAVAREMFTGRPETKVVIHETWDSVPKEMHPKNAAAKATIPSLIDNANDTIHVIRNAPNKAGADLMTNVRHERGHSVDDFKPEEVTDALADKMRERLPQMMNEHGVPAGEVNRLLSLDQPGFIAEMKRMAADKTTTQIPTLLAQEAVATLMQEYRADPSKVGLFMAKAARKIPGVQMTANDIRAIMAERMGARGEGPAKIEMVGEKPAEVMPQPKPAEAPALKKGDTVYLPSSQPAIRLYDTGTITSIGKDGKVRVVVNGKGGKAGDRFVELAQDQVSLEPPAIARESIPTPDQIAEQQRMSDIARQQRQNIAETEAGRRFVYEAVERQRPLIDNVLEQPVGPEARQLKPGADVRPGLLEEIINPAEGTPNDPFLLRGPDGRKLRAAASKPPKATVDPLLPADEAPYDFRNLNYQNVADKPTAPGVDRRRHAELQKQFAGRRWLDLTNEERIARGYMNEKTGLPNLRHFEDFADTPEGRAQRPSASFYDLDDFKEMNTRLSHDGVDAVVLPVVGDTIKEVLADERFADIVDVSHIQGDEFVARATTREATDAFWAEVNARFKDAEFSYTMPDGTVYHWKGLGGSHGVGPDKATAEADLARAKEARKAAGLRVGYRDRNVEGTTGGREALDGTAERPGVDAGNGLDAEADAAVAPFPEALRPAFQNVAQTKTPEFKKWFGESKVVDEKGEPKVMYHGTGTPGFSVFDRSRQDPEALWGPGFYFTDAPDIAGGVVKEGRRYSFFDSERAAKEFISGLRDGWKLTPFEMEVPDTAKPGAAQKRWAVVTDDGVAVEKRGYAHSVEPASREERLERAEAIRNSWQWHRLMKNGGLSGGEWDSAQRYLKDYAGHRKGGQASLDLLSEQPYNLPVGEIFRDAGFIDVGGVVPAYIKIEKPLEADKPIGHDGAAALLESWAKWFEEKGKPDAAAHVRRGARSVAGNIWAADGPTAGQALDYARSSLVSYVDSAGTAMRDFLEDSGYDGIVHRGGDRVGWKAHNVAIAFRPEQIKSATGNVGTFDPTNPDIRFQNVAGRSEASRANKNLLDPIRGDVIRFGASLVDEHGTPESFIRKMSEGLEGSAKLEMQKMASDVFEDVKAFRAGQIEVDSVLKQMEAGVKPKGDLGKPAEGKARDLLDAVDAAREREDIPHRRKDSQVEKEAIKLRAKLGRQGVINLAVDVAKQMTLPKGVKNAITGNLRMLSDVETLAIRMEMNDLDAMGAGWNDPKKALENVLLANAYRTTGSDPARSMRMRRWDIGMTNPERVRSVLFDMAYDPSSRNAAALADSNSAFHKASVRQMEKQLQRARDFLKDETGYDRIEDIPDALLLDKTYMKNIVDRWSAKIAPMSAKARTWYLNSILSAPKTHVANMTGNTLNFVTEYYGHRRLEALINDLLDKTGAGKDVSGVRSSDLSGLMSQLISIENSAFKQAMALEGSQLKIDGGLVGQAGKDAKQFFKTREAQLRRRVEGEDWIGELREKKQSFSGTPGKIITAPSRALGMADEFGKSLMGHMEALVSARQIAREMGHKVNSPEYNAEVHKQLADYDSAAWHKALERSEYLAFQSEHRKIVKSLLALRHAHPQLSFVVPFITTPVNLFARAFEFVPGLGIRFRGDVGLTKGNYKGKEIPGEKNAGDYKSRMIAAQLIGSAATVMLGTLGLDAFKEGEDEPWITGSEPPPKFSKGEREARQRSLQPYTIKNPFGEGRISYKRLDPLSTTAAVTVDFVHALRDWNTHGDITRAAAIMKQSILGQAVGKTFLQTPGEIVQWLQDKPGSDPLGPVKTIVAGFYPNLLRAAAQAFFDDVVYEQRQYGAKEGELGQNPTERLAKTFGYRLLGAPSLPGVGDLVEPKVAYGEEVKRGGSAPYRFISPLDIYPGGSPDARTMDLRFLRSTESLPDAEDSLPTEMQPKVRFGGKTIALTPEDWAAAEKARGGLYLDVLKNAGFTKDRQKPLEAWELEAIKKINEKTSKMAHPYAAKYFGGK